MKPKLLPVTRASEVVENEGMEASDVYNSQVLLCHRLSAPHQELCRQLRQPVNQTLTADSTLTRFQHEIEHKPTANKTRL